MAAPLVTRLFKRIGPKIFAAAVVWYVLGNVLMGHVQKHNLELARSLHKNEQHFSLDGVTEVQVSSDDDVPIMARLKIIFDANSSQVAVTNSNLNIAADKSVSKGVMQFKFSLSPHRGYEPQSEIVLRLPVDVATLDIRHVRFVNLSGQFTAPGAALKVNVLDCVPEMYADDLAVNSLNITTACKPSSGSTCCGNAPVLPAGVANRIFRRGAQTISVGEGVVTHHFSVSMAGGELHYSSKFIPEHIDLNLGDDATVTGRLAFFQAAKLVRLPDESQPDKK